VRRGLLKSYDVPDVLLPFPWTFHNGKIRQSANLGRKELQEWRADITAIVVGQFDFDQLLTPSSKKKRGEAPVGIERSICKSTLLKPTTTSLPKRIPI
jgi:hypothetical protein